jgi:hypothetical protein
MVPRTMHNPELFKSDSKNIVAPVFDTCCYFLELLPCSPPHAGSDTTTASNQIIVKNPHEYYAMLL